MLTSHISVTYSIVPLPVLMDCYGSQSTALICMFGSYCYSHCKFYVPVRYMATIFPACILPGILYICMYCKAKKLKKDSTSATEEKPKPDYKVTITSFLLFLSTVLLLLVPAIGLGIVVL